MRWLDGSSPRPPQRYVGAAGGERSEHAFLTGITETHVETRHSPWTPRRRYGSLCTELPSGAQESLDLVVSRGYQELRAIAHRRLTTRGRSGDAVDDGAHQRGVPQAREHRLSAWHDRAHFLALAALAMRHVSSTGSCSARCRCHRRRSRCQTPRRCSASPPPGCPSGRPLRSASCAQPPARRRRVAPRRLVHQEALAFAGRARAQVDRAAGARRRSRAEQLANRLDDRPWRMRSGRRWPA